MARSYDFLGNIAIVNFPEKINVGHRSVYPKKLSAGVKKKIANEILKTNKSVKTILEKSGKIHGRLRKPKLKYIMGEKTKEVLYRENDCVFRFNAETTYFSPRLSNERKEIADLIKKNDEVFVMFAGVAPFSIVIAKKSKAKIVYSNEINREANKYGRINAKLNKVQNKMVFVDGDIKKVASKLDKTFSCIIMPRPQLKDSFLKQAFALSKKGTRIYYYDFCKVEDIDKVVDKVKKEADENKKKIKIAKIKRAGEIAPYKVRIRIDFKILS